MDILVTSDKKGSNPGGKVRLDYRGSIIDFYLKYAHTSKLKKDVPYLIEHQPIYETLTLTLAEKLGLEVPLNFVLDNRENIVNFNFEKGVEKKLDDGRPFYFVSKLTGLEMDEDTEEAKIMMADEKLYRDLLLIGDVSNKRQNYGLINKEGNKRILYLDVGCSFVDSTNGILSQRNESLNLRRTLDGALKNSFKTDYKHAMHYLSNVGISTNHIEYYKKDVLIMSTLIEDLPDQKISLYPNKPKPLSELLTEAEIDEIQGTLAINFDKVLRKYSKSKYSELIIHA